VPPEALHEKSRSAETTASLLRQASRSSGARLGYMFHRATHIPFTDEKNQGSRNRQSDLW